MVGRWRGMVVSRKMLVPPVFLPAIVGGGQTLHRLPPRCGGSELAATRFRWLRDVPRLLQGLSHTAEACLGNAAVPLPLGRGRAVFVEQLDQSAERLRFATRKILGLRLAYFEDAAALAVA